MPLPDLARVGRAVRAAIALPGVLPRMRPLSLGGRLALLIGTAAGLTAAVCVVVVLVGTLWLADKRSLDLTQAVGRMTAHTLRQPLADDDPGRVRDVLAMLDARRQVGGAWVFDRNGTLVARHGTAALPPPGVTGGLREGFRVGEEAVIVGGDVVGRLVLRTEMDDAFGVLAFAASIIGLGSLLAMALSVLLGRRIARTISGPVVQLADTATSIALSQDYRQRLPVAGADEVGRAIAAFNFMLAELERRGNGMLELKVADRTRELEDDKAKAEAASLAKTSFLSNMSHELRTPLNAVIGAAQLLDESGIADEAQAHLVAAIRDSGTRLLGLVENILDMSRIESGALELECEPFNLVEAVEAALATASVQARLKGVRSACIVSPELPAWRRGDALRLRQVLLNLLGNAVKFTQHGEVVLRVTPSSTPGGVHLQVRDTGIGMTEAALQHIFEPFRQADNSTTRRFGGSGLGLTISRQLVHAMGGRLEVRSVAGEGTCFDLWVDLPLAADPVTVPVPPLDFDILVYEPHEASAQALEATLLRMGCRAWRCQQAQDLQAWFSSRPAEASPWLLVAVDAPQAWAVLEAAAAWVDAERVIGMTHAESHSAEMARELHRVPRNVIKPVTRAALVSRFGGGPRDAGRSRPDAACGTPAAPRRVLVVEDDPLNQLIVCTMLGNAGYLTEVADNGMRALERVAAQAFDLILMDWQMPDLDGLETTRRLRAGHAGPSGLVVPVVALTANAFTEDRAACLEAGMNDFLTKPVQAAVLEETVARWVHGATPPMAATRPVGDLEGAVVPDAALLS